MSAVTEATATSSAFTTRLRRKLPSGVLGFTMFFTGGAGFVYQSILGAVFTNLLGNSMEQIILTMGFMMGMMGVAVWLQKFLRGPLVEYFVICELALAGLGGFAPIILQWTFATSPDNFGIVRLAYPAVIALLIGFEIPLAMLINEKFARNLSTNLAETSAWDYVGAFVGTLGWLWALKHFVPIGHLSFWVAMSNMIVAIVSLAFFWNQGMLTARTSKILLSLGTVTVALALVVGNHHTDAWSRTIGQKLYDNPIVFHTTTKYQDIVMTAGVHPLRPGDKNYELFLNGNKQFSSVDERIYHEYLVHPAMNLAARHARVLVLGGGDGLAVRELLKYQDVQSITLVDLDPQMIELARTNPIMRKLNEDSFGDARVSHTISDGVHDTGERQDVLLTTDEVKQVNCETTPQGAQDCDVERVVEKTASVSIYTIDADRFVSVPQQPYDVIIVDLPDPNSIELAKLYSLEFYQKIRRAVSPDGIVAVQATSPYHARESYLCIMRTMEAAGLTTLPYHANVPSFGDWGWLLGSPTLRPQTMHTRAQALTDYGVPTAELTASSMPSALHFGKGWLVGNNDRISTVLNPAVFSLYTYEAWKGE